MGQRPTLLRLAVAAAAGGLTGAALLLALPGRAFELVAPALIAGASLIVLLQPWLEDRPLFRPRGLRPGTVAAFYATAVYTGYFGAAALAFAVFGPVAWVYVVPLAAGHPRVADLSPTPGRQRSRWRRARSALVAPTGALRTNRAPAASGPRGGQAAR